MKIDRETHLLVDAKQIASPNFNERPENEISLLVIHNISLPPGQFDTGCIEDLFCNRLDIPSHPYFEQLEGVEVSAHLLIDRKGQVIQFVPFNKRAWHAGESMFEGRQRCNDFSIGIELEGTDTDPYTPVQYERLIAVTQALMDVYSDIQPERIKGHHQIAPGRKTDPGESFDWDFYLKHF